MKNSLTGACKILVCVGLPLCLFAAACNGKSEPVLPSPEYTSCYEGDCAYGLECVQVIDGDYATNVCLVACDPNAPNCLEGEACVPGRRGTGAAFCRPACGTTTEECPVGTTCDTGSGVCRCGRDADCATYSSVNEDDYGCSARTSTCVEACSTDEDCHCGAVCREGICDQGCNSDTDCCGGATCNQGVCGEPGRGEPGAHCSNDSHCREDLACWPSSLLFERGRDMCLGPSLFGRGCLDADCPSGTSCVLEYVRYETETVAVGICAPSCGDGFGPCESGDECSHASYGQDNGACLPTCELDAQCGQGMRCEDGRCNCRDDDACEELYGRGGECNVVSGACLCEPDCEGRVCGDDGCGGSCGECDGAYACREGACLGECGGDVELTLCGDGRACNPNSECGTDGCRCLPGYVSETCDGEPCSGQDCGELLEYRCAECVPDCAGAECGDDGCGGSCGVCGTNSVCQAGECVERTGGGGGGGGGSDCGVCNSPNLCVTYNDGSEATCSAPCNDNSDCASNCCGALESGELYCIHAEYCGGGGGGGLDCAGEFPIYCANNGGYCCTEAYPVCLDGGSCGAAGGGGGGGSGTEVYGDCASSFVDEDFYDWVAIRNNCSFTVRITWCSASQGCLIAEIPGGGHDSTGFDIDWWTRNGPWYFYGCLPGGVPKDSSGNLPSRSRPNINYACDYD